MYIYQNIFLKLDNIVSEISRINGIKDYIMFIIPTFLAIFIVKGIKKSDKESNTRYNELIKEHKNSNSVLTNVQDELNKMISYKESLEVKYEEKKRAIKECEEQFLELLSQV